MDKIKLLSQSALIDMGWTKSLIRDFLPEPILKPNPMYASAPEMKCYREEDVNAAMQSAEFLAAKSKADKRKASAAKAVTTKTEKLVRSYADIASKIEVEVWPYPDLRSETIRSKRLHYMMIDKDFYGDVDQATLDRWIVNFIRHELVSYDYDLFQLKGKTGKDEAYSLYRDVVLRKIAEAYPQFSEECCRQAGHDLFADTKGENT